LSISWHYPLKSVKVKPRTTQRCINRYITRLGITIRIDNDRDQMPDLVEHFDWALNEPCFQYEECELLLPFSAAGKAIFGVEYAKEGLDPAEYCPAALAYGFSWLTKTYDLGDLPPNACGKIGENGGLR